MCIFPETFEAVFWKAEVSSPGFEMLGPALGTQATGQCHLVNVCSPEVEMAMLKFKPSLEISLEAVAAKTWS